MNFNKYKQLISIYFHIHSYNITIDFNIKPSITMRFGEAKPSAKPSLAFPKKNENDYGFPIFWRRLRFFGYHIVTHMLLTYHTLHTLRYRE
jgi:hypothetical protein